MKPVVLMILDGFGISSETSGNAIACAKAPNLERLGLIHPATTLGASGLDVGLPRGQMGNSEVGHLNLGSGRIVYQDYTRINLAIENGTIFSNEVIVSAMRNARGRSLHLMGLLSDGGVHSHNTHLYALLKMAKEQGVSRVYVHAILDGRDVPPRSALVYVKELLERMAEIGLGTIATTSGRYYTMDRDRRWERTQRAYIMLTKGDGLKSDSASQAVIDSYQRGENDEFLIPTVVDPNGLIKDGDSVIFFNFRPDRARQITRAFVDPKFCEFDALPLSLHFVCMTQYDSSLSVQVAFPPEKRSDTIGEVVSRAGLRQLRIAETEKYAHVTYFFNGGVEKPNLGEDRVLIPSPKVATYDLKPEMSAFEVTDAVVERIRSGLYDLIIMNFANPDMVGHTGIMQAAVKAIEAVDTCAGRVVDEVLAAGGAVIITADHGNAEKMVDSTTGQPHTAHTNNPVPCALHSRAGRHDLRPCGILADVAPTLLDLLGIQSPDAMTGRTLQNI